MSAPATTAPGTTAPGPLSPGPTAPGTTALGPTAFATHHQAGRRSPPDVWLTDAATIVQHAQAMDQQSVH